MGYDICYPERTHPYHTIIFYIIVVVVVGFFPVVPSVEKQEKCSLQNPNDQQIVVKTILYISGVIYGCLDVCSSDLIGLRQKIGPSAL